ncbi:MAG: hypothetical protein Q9169_006589, partial [Polycauliona sp. 2 TL-2023]
YKAAQYYRLAESKGSKTLGNSCSTHMSRFGGYGNKVLRIDSPEYPAHKHMDPKTPCMTIPITIPSSPKPQKEASTIMFQITPSKDG